MSYGPSYFAAADAYEADIANAGVPGFLGPRDGTWLDWANTLARAAALVPSLQSRYLKVVIASHCHEDSLADMPVLEAMVRHSMALAGEAQDNDAFATGMIILDLARTLTPLGESRLQGRMLAEQGRILQNIGELDAARDLYAEVERLARWAEDGELLARAHAGIGTLARMRGDEGETHRRFDAVLAQPSSSQEMRELRIAARHELSAIASPASTCADSLALAWEMYVDEALDSSRRVEMLIDVARLLRLVGEPRASLNAHLTSLTTPTIRRLRLTTLSGGALAAAQLGERAIFEPLAEATERLVDHVGHQYEAADADRALAEAWFFVGENGQAGRLKRRGLARARGRFHDVEAELVALGTKQPTPTPRTSLPESARRARDAFAHDDSCALIAAARARPDW
jgi:hypothetical protein